MFNTIMLTNLCNILLFSFLNFSYCGVTSIFHIVGFCPVWFCLGILSRGILSCGFAMFFLPMDLLNDVCIKSTMNNCLFLEKKADAFENSYYFSDEQAQMCR